MELNLKATQTKMKSPNIISPMVTGNGAHVIHRTLENCIPGYRVLSYHPCYTYFPLVIPFKIRTPVPDLIHTTPSHAIFSCRRAVPLVISFQNYVLDRWMMQYSTSSQRLHYKTDLRLWFNLAAKKSNAITAVSKFTSNLVKQDMKLTKPVKIIYNGVDTNKFTPSATSRFSDNEVRVFFSGNLTRRKGAQWLPAIASRLNRNIKIYYTQGLRTLSTLPYHPALQSIGPVPYEEMPRRYLEMDILLMPTVREGLCVSVLEAMSSGLPVIASDCSSLPEQIVEGKGGFLCAVGDEDAFAEKINLLADSPCLRKEMGEYNRARVEQFFTAEQMIRGYQSLFEEVLAS
jgi:glycosyltransferase involved in cell wall biosynthesis